MSDKIFKSIWLVAASVFLASLIFIMGISYNYFTTLQKKQLKNETELAAQGVVLCGKSFFDSLNVENYRITWIAADGSVLYDSEANTARLKNHLEREEVKQAIRQGYGEASRYSSALSEKQLYVAKRLPNGSILRLSIVQKAIWTLLFGFAQPICVVIVIAMALSFALASQLAKKIVKPINEIDLNNPELYYGKKNYREVEPLLRHISTQQRQVKRDQEQIEKTALIRQEFTANVSHELKTPLHAVSGYAELLENGMVKDEDIKPFAGKIRTETSRLTKLVEDIIELTKLDSGAADSEWETCDLYRIAENAVDSLEASAAAANVELKLAGTDAPMKGTPQSLYGVVYNLCDNAIKYNRKGGRVNVCVRQADGFTVLTVKDTGIGIPEESLTRIFERFYRVDKSRSKEVGGTGLGLSIVKHAVLNHNGTIKIKSVIGEGSEFTVSLPTEPPAS